MRPYLSSLLTLLAAVSALAASAAGYRVEKWNPTHGLPQNRIQALLQTTDGYLWIGTPSGLARYDGSRFTVFDPANTPLMVPASSSCTAFAEDRRDNSLLIGTPKGLLRYANFRFSRFTREDGLIHETVLSLAASRTNGVWVGTHGGVCRFIGGNFTSLPVLAPLNKANIGCLLEDRSARLWIGSSQGLFRFDPDSLSLLPIIETRNITALFEDSKGRNWIGVENGNALSCWSNGTFRTIALAPQDAGARQSIRGIVEDRAGNILVSVSGRGLHRLQGERLVLSDAASDLPPDIGKGLLDREGDLWFSTSRDGLLRLGHSKVKTITFAGSAKWNNVWSICEDRQGRLCLGTDAGALRVEDGEPKPVPFDVSDGREEAVNSIFVDHAGDVWAARGAEGLWRLKEERFVQVERPVAGFPFNWRVTALAEDPGGTLWLGSHQALWWRSATNFEVFRETQGLVHDKVSAILPIAKDELWVGTFGGLDHLSNGVFRNFTVAAGLPHEIILSLQRDRDGALWIGTQRGLTRFKAGRFVTLTTGHGLPANEVNAILDDGLGRFWIACHAGIYRVSQDDLNSAADGKAKQVACLRFGESDGMPSAETNGRHQPAACKARDGTLWFATQKGAVGINPREVSEGNSPQPVHIEQVQAGKSVVFGDGCIDFTLPVRDQHVRFPAAHGRSVEFHYTATSLVAPHLVRFRYKLEGHDSEWHEAGTRRFAVYTNLKPGPYVFRVVACNSQGLWNPANASFSFHVAPHFYQTWWFRGACVVALLGVVAGALRLARRFEALKAGKAMAEQRARIAQDIHDGIGANLTNIALLNEVVRANMDKPELARAETNKIASIAGETLDSLRDFVWATNPKYDSLESFVAYLREYIAGTLELSGLRYTLNFAAVTETPLADGFRRHILFITKEALQNIQKHSRATHVTVSLKVEDDQLRLCIEDNGLGLAESRRSNHGAGLSGIRARTAELQGTVEFISREGGGLRIDLTAPLLTALAR